MLKRYMDDFVLYGSGGVAYLATALAGVMLSGGGSAGLLAQAATRVVAWVRGVGGTARLVATAATIGGVQIVKNSS